MSFLSRKLLTVRGALSPLGLLLLLYCSAAPGLPVKRCGPQGPARLQFPCHVLRAWDPFSPPAAYLCCGSWSQLWAGLSVLLPHMWVDLLPGCLGSENSVMGRLFNPVRFLKGPISVFLLPFLPWLGSSGEGGFSVPGG